MVAVVGDVGLDVVVRSPGPLAVGSDTPSDVRLTHGGAAGNTAAWLAALGADPVLVARVGQDDAATMVRAELERAGVRTALAVDPALPTCCVVVLADAGGVRTMLPGRGASGALSAADVDAAELRGVDHVHVSGYVLLDPATRAAGRAALERARALGCTTSVDPQADALLHDVPQFLADVAGVDLLLPNEAELAALTGRTKPGDGADRLVAAAAALLHQVGAVVVTGGAGGARWVDAAGAVAVPAVATPVVDPTGAGDAFDAGLLVAWLGGAAPEQALEAAVRAGAAVVGRVGARPGD